VALQPLDVGLDSTDALVVAGDVLALGGDRVGDPLDLALDAAQ
jgi:hypothetical protein